MRRRGDGGRPLVSAPTPRDTHTQEVGNKAGVSGAHTQSQDLGKRMQEGQEFKVIFSYLVHGTGLDTLGYMRRCLKKRRKNGEVDMIGALLHCVWGLSTDTKPQAHCRVSWKLECVCRKFKGISLLNTKKGFLPHPWVNASFVSPNDRVPSTSLDSGHC